MTPPLQQSQASLPVDPAPAAAPVAPAWYKPTLGPRLAPEMRVVLEKYSGIAAEQIEPHVSAVRDRAWSLYKYPCIGQWQFLSSRTPHLPQYPQLLSRARSGATVLDLGCCFAQDLRLLAAAGAPTSSMYASDIVDFWSLGLGLFRDQDRMNAKFFQADVFDAGSDMAVELEGKVDFVLASHFFHLFSWEKQIEAARAVTRMLKKGGWLLGYNIGTKVAKETPAGQTKGSDQAGSKFYHDEESWRMLWDEVGRGTETEWKVDTRLQDLEEWMPKEDFAWMGESARGLSFAVMMKE